MRNRKILLADNIELFLELEKNFLARPGVKLLSAHDGEKALDIIRKNKPDLVFLGLHLPLMCGDECCRTVKKDKLFSTIPIIMVVPSGTEAAVSG
jgi:DNA-binding response OmpR family regulator